MGRICEKTYVYHKTKSYYISDYFFLETHMFKTPLIQLASLGLFMAGAQASGGYGSCVTNGQPANTGVNMGIYLHPDFLNGVLGATAQQDDGLGNLIPYDGQFSCSSTNCEIIAETPQGLVVGRNTIGQSVSWAGIQQLPIFGDDSTTDEKDGAGYGDVISFHLVDDNGVLFDVTTSIKTYSTNTIGYLTAAPSSIVFNCQPVQPVSGCTDASADNYNAAATQDDGSCMTHVLGCTDASAANYNAAATQDDGSCVFPVLGCTTVTAFGFNPLATTDDDTCVTVGAPAGTAPAGTAVFALDSVNKNANWGQATDYADDNGVQVYNDFNLQGIIFDALDVSGDASVHIDYNIHDLGQGTEVRLYLASTNNEKEFGIALSNNGDDWQSDDIALSAFADAGVDLSQVDQIKLALIDNVGATQTGGAVAVANIVFKAAPVSGCTNEEANNYNAAATEDDGSCIVPSGTTAKRDKGKNKAKNKLIAAGLDGTLVDNIGSLAITDGKRGIGSIMSKITAGGYEVRKSVIRAALAEGNEVSFDLDDDANIPQSIKDALEAKTISKVVAKQGKTRNTAKKAALLAAADGGAAICGGNDVDVYIEDVPAGEMVEVVFEAVGDVSIKCWDQTRPLSHMALTSEDPPTAKVRCWDVDQWANPITVNQDESYVCQGFTSYMLSDGTPADTPADADSDGDGTGDNADTFPDDATETVDSDGDGVGDNADVNPDVASVQTCAQQEDYWLTAGCATCGGGAGGENDIGSTAWCDAQKGLWTAAGCGAQCPAQ
jgi:hypothetical protein